jgi:hypothetical protein
LRTAIEGSIGVGDQLVDGGGFGVEVIGGERREIVCGKGRERGKRHARNQDCAEATASEAKNRISHEGPVR